MRRGAHDYIEKPWDNERLLTVLVLAGMWFTRKGGHIFDISLHGFPIGMIKSCRKYWSQDIADSIVQLKGVRFVPQVTAIPAGTKVRFTSLEHIGHFSWQAAYESNDLYQWFDQQKASQNR